MAIALIGTEYEIPFYDFDPKSAAGERRQERFHVKIETEGSLEDALKGAKTGQTAATLLEPGKEGVRIPRGLNIAMFWKVIEECVQRADEANAKSLNGSK